METILIDKLKIANPDLQRAQIEGLLYLLRENDVLTTVDMVKITGLPKSIISSFKKTVVDLLDASSEHFSLSEGGRLEFTKYAFRPYAWCIFDFGENIEIQTRFEELRKKYFFQAKREFDQFFATPKTSVAKALSVQAKTGIKGMKIALMGDDDLLSISIPLICSDYKEIVVFDVDPDILEQIKHAAADLGFKNVRTVLYDARNPIPAIYQNYFDVVFTDPPYTKSGFDLFLDRCIELSCVKKDYSGSYIFICYGIGVKNIEQEVKLTESLNIRNLFLEDKVFKFNRYTGAETVGSSSSLYILRTTPFTAVVQSPVTTNIYTFENVKDEKFPYVDHYVFKLFDVDMPTIKSKTKLTQITGEFCTKHRFKVVNTFITHFKPHGFSLTYILANSNLVIHTWDEFGSVHVDLITCSPVYNAQNLANNLMKLFGARNIEYYKVA